MAKKRLKNLQELQDLQLELRKDQPQPEQQSEEKPKEQPRPKRPAKRFGMNQAEKRKHQAEQAEASPEDEAVLFSRAMQGVDPLKESIRGREVQPESQPPPPRWSDADQQAMNRLSGLVAGDVEFEIEYSDEYMHGHVKGADLKAVNQLKAGALAVDAHLDLHGLNSDQARDSLLFFLHECYLQSKRCVLLVPGRGKNSPGGQSILKREIQAWLTQDPLKRMVLAFCTAQPKHGGAGALYVLLRKIRKNQGKVRWNRG
jgi:DNA-nicking Smr family endonuclease